MDANHGGKCIASGIGVCENETFVNLHLRRDWLVERPDDINVPSDLTKQILLIVVSLSIVVVVKVYGFPLMSV